MMVLALMGGMLAGFAIGVHFMDWYYGRKFHYNVYRIDMARTYYGRRWAKAIIECDAAHLTGDCVLCGGESVSAPSRPTQGAET